MPGRIIFAGESAFAAGDDEIIAISFIFAASEFILPARCSFMKKKTEKK